MDQKGHIIDQKGLKMYEKNGVFGPNKPAFSGIFLSGIFLSGIGGYPLPPP